jgi:flagellar motor switch protein FliN/FliY
VPVTRASIQEWLSEEFATRLASVFEMMAGKAPAVHWEAASAAPQEAALLWRQPYSGLKGAVWVTAAGADRNAAAAYALRAAEVEENDPASLKSTFLEIAGQALSGLEQAFSGRLRREITRDGGKEETEFTGGNAGWIVVHLKLDEEVVNLSAGFETVLIDAVVEAEAKQADAAKPAAAARPPANPSAPGPQDSKTFDLLLEVELPVSVSFGRAQVPLREVLKLTTGSIVELNRAVSDPVEVIVNNCVIARGEVVVVEGNFGVRIQQVISRQERLRTLD